MANSTRLALTIIVLLAAALDAEAAKKPPLCTAGRFAVQGPPLLGPGGEVLVLADRKVAIGSLCAPRKATLKRLKAGTRLVVVYRKGGCTGVTGQVRLVALLTDSCTLLKNGKIKAPRTKAVTFSGALSRCGDGILDAGATPAEQCDGTAACTDGQLCSTTCTCAQVLRRASKSGTIAISDDGKLVAMVNPDDDSVSIFRTADNTRVSKVPVGDEPSAVALAPDSTTAFVANRAAATVVKVTGIDTTAPVVSPAVGVGSEPTGLALSPTGSRLFVAELAEGRVSVIDTKSMAFRAAIGGLANPRAVAVTNDGDADDDDELIIVPEFFGEPTAGGETKDTGRTGRVRIYKAGDLSEGPPIVFAPIDSGFHVGGVGANPTIMTSPNQLWAVALRGQRIYVPSVSASPEGPPRFDNNVFAVVWVGDLDSRQPVPGSGGGTTNLTRKVVDTFTPPPARFVLGDLADMDFVPKTSVSYVVSRAADCVQRVTWTDTGVTLGSTQTRQIDVLGNATIGNCQAPSGIALSADASRAYVNCYVSRRLGVIDLTSQTLAATVVASDPPTSDSEKSIQRGKRFYFTGRGRWSNAGGSGPGGVGAGGNGTAGGEGWSSCGSCHPDGLTDNVTWVFPAGPRQTVSQDGSFSHGPGAQKQRIFNHSGIFDEHHDFENNTRNVSGGLGAITTAPNVTDCNNLTLETQVVLAGATNLGRPAKEVADDPATLCQHKDWDDIDNFVKTIRPPGRLRTPSAGSVANGLALFQAGECAQCHGGAGWTLSRRFYTPLDATNTALLSTDFVKPVSWPSTWTYLDGGMARKQISVQPPILVADQTGPAELAPAILPTQVACVLRNVGTFGVFGDAAATDALELKASASQPAPRAQGRAGYNIPSLYGLALGRPYLHHGQAKTLEDLFTSAKYDFHTNAGNAQFSITLASNPQNVSDLKSFLLSIDASTAEIAPPSGFDGCPAQFP